MNRPEVKLMNEMIGEEIKVLDHGFIRLIDYMGNDAAVVQAARVSYGKGTKTNREDAGLINYLMRNKHTTPFEMAEIKFHVKLPIFVARQWIRHRTGSFNEYSGRYSIMDKDFYVPSHENLGLQSTSNKQGRGGQLGGSLAVQVIDNIWQHSKQAYTLYTNLLDEGVSRELSRMALPINYYSQWYWKVDLKNLLDFLNLRTDPHAQYEIRVYADEIAKIVQKWVPAVYAAYEEHMKNSYTLSKTAINTVRCMIEGDNLTQETSGLNKREFDELMKVLEAN